MPSWTCARNFANNSPAAGNSQITHNWPFYHNINPQYHFFLFCSTNVTYRSLLRSERELCKKPSNLRAKHSEKCPVRLSTNTPRVVATRQQQQHCYSLTANDKRGKMLGSCHMNRLQCYNDPRLIRVFLFPADTGGSRLIPMCLIRNWGLSQLFSKSLFFSLMC